jgi:hypothetical protein
MFLSDIENVQLPSCLVQNYTVVEGPELSWWWWAKYKTIIKTW